MESTNLLPKPKNSQSFTEALKKFGFNKESIEVALERCNGDIDMATNLLLTSDKCKINQFFSLWHNSFLLSHIYS